MESLLCGIVSSSGFSEQAYYGFDIIQRRLLQPGSDRVETLLRNQWKRSNGTGGNFETEYAGSDIRPLNASFCPSVNHTDFFTPLKALLSLSEATLYSFQLITLPTLLRDEPIGPIERKCLICICSGR